MPSYRLRNLEPKDQDILEGWLRDYLHHHISWWSKGAEGVAWPDDKIQAHMEEHDLVAAEWRNLMRASTAQENFVRVAHDGTGVAGVVWAEVKKDRYLCSSMGVISWIYADPERRRAGIGSLLLEACDAWMSWRGVSGRTLHVTAANKAACALYRQHGYQVSDHRLLGTAPATHEERGE